MCNHIIANENANIVYSTVLLCSVNKSVFIDCISFGFYPDTTFKINVKKSIKEATPPMWREDSGLKHVFL